MEAARRRPANGQIADAAFLEWRYLRSPRAYRVLGAFRGDTLDGAARAGGRAAAGSRSSATRSARSAQLLRATASREADDRARPARAARRLPRGGLRPDPQADPRPRQAAASGRQPRRPLAVPARRLRRLLKLIFVTQQVDPADPVLGATVAKLRALAAQVDELVVLSLGAVPGSLPRTAASRRSAAASKATRGLRFARALAPELRGADAVLAHMCPIYAVLAAPLARPLRVPVLLWFAHWRASPLLRAATAASTNVLSVDTPLVPARDAEARPARPRDRLRRARVQPASRRRRAARDRPRPHLAGEGARDDHSRRQRGTGDATRRLRHLRQRRGARAPRRARAPDRRARAGRPRRDPRSGPARPDRRAPRRRRRARQQHARRRSRQGRLRGLRELPARARVEPVLRRALRGDRAAASLRARVGRRARRPPAGARGARAQQERATIGRTLRERAVASHSVDSWAARRPRSRAGR